MGVEISELYTDLMDLINQQFYMKNEVDNKLNIIDITEGLNQYLEDLGVSNVTDKLYMSICEDMDTDLKTLIKNYLINSNNIMQNQYFKIYSTICDGNIIGLIMENNNVLILTNPEIIYDIHNKETNLKELLISNLTAKGVDVNENMTLPTLANKILEIINKPIVGGIRISTNISLTTDDNLYVGRKYHLTGLLSAFYDDTSSTDVDLSGFLQGASIKIYEDNVILGIVNTNDYGEYDYSYVPQSEGTHNLKAVFEGTEYYDSSESIITRDLSVFTSLNVTADKNILSYVDNDNCTLSAIVMGENNNPLANKSVVFKMGDTVLATKTTDSEGVAEYTYNSQGVGDVSINVECMNLQEICNIEDAIYYNDMTSADGHWTIPSSANATYSSNGMKLQGSAWADCYLEVPLTKPYSVEFDLTQWSGATTYTSYFWDSTKSKRYVHMQKTDVDYTVFDVYPSYENSYHGGIPQGSHIKIVINNDYIRLCVNGVLKLTKLYSMPSSSIYGVATGTNRSTTWKNIKIKPL